MYELRPYQTAAVEATFRSINSGGRPVITAPTGSGKSVIQAEIVRRYLEEHPDARVLCVVHTRELVEQNAEKIRNLLGVPVGVVHGNAKMFDAQITCATVNTLYRRPEWLARPLDLVIIDECHRVPKRTAKPSMYSRLLDAAEGGNPDIHVVGMTATPFRAQAMLVDPPGNTFTQQAYEISIKELIDEGYLSMLKTTYGEETGLEKKLAGIKMAGANVFGERDYDTHQLSVFMRQSARLGSHVDQIIRLFENRKCWLVFGVDVDHVEALTEALRAKGVACRGLTGRTPKEVRARYLCEFREGRLKCLVNCQILTTGFDAPRIDALAMVRATQSRTLYVQIAGRGMRTAEGKEDCAYLDFGGNVDRFGPINSMVRLKRPRFKKKKPPVSESTSPRERKIPDLVASRRSIIDLESGQYHVVAWSVDWAGKSNLVIRVQLAVATADLVLHFGKAARFSDRAWGAQLWRKMHSQEGILQAPRTPSEAAEQFHLLDMPDRVTIDDRRRVAKVHYDG